MSEIDPPELLDGAGLALWNTFAEELEFGPHELVIAAELCKTVSLCEDMHRRLHTDGLILDGERGPKINPIAAELRQQRLVVARLIASLGIPPLEDDDETTKPRGAVRGVYSVGGTA